MTCPEEWLSVGTPFEKKRKSPDEKSAIKVQHIMTCGRWYQQQIDENIPRDTTTNPEETGARRVERADHHRRKLTNKVVLHILNEGTCQHRVMTAQFKPFASPQHSVLPNANRPRSQAGSASSGTVGSSAPKPVPPFPGSASTVGSSAPQILAKPSPATQSGGLPNELLPLVQSDSKYSSACDVHALCSKSIKLVQASVKPEIPLLGPEHFADSHDSTHKAVCAWLQLPVPQRRSTSPEFS